MVKNKKTRTQRVKEGNRKSKAAIKAKERKKNNKKKIAHANLMKQHFLIKRHKMLIDMIEKARIKQKQDLEAANNPNNSKPTDVNT